MKHQSSGDNPSSKKMKASSTLGNWEVGDRYDVMEILGKGSYGQVAKAQDRKLNRHVAIKQMKKIFDEPTDAKRAYREMHILRHLRHPSIVALHDVIATSIDQNYMRNFEAARAQSNTRVMVPRNLGNLYLVFEFVDTDLAKIIKSSQFLTGEHIQYVLYQIIDGLRYIHLTNVIHRDLKPANVLISCNDCTIKIADFGLSRVVGSDLIVSQSMKETVEPLEQDQVSSPDDADGLENGLSADNESTRPLNIVPLPSIPLFTNNLQPVSSIPQPLPLKRGLTKHVVTRWYRAPEVILLQPYSAAVDIWSVGCIFAELLGLIADNVADHSKRKALFPGDSCGELSADELMQLHQSQSEESESATAEYHRQLQESYANNRSQLNVIFNVIGTPTERDLSSVEPKIAEVLRRLDVKAGRGFKALFPRAENAAIDLLEQLLKFDPSVRISAAAALDHPYFDEIKKKGYIDSYKSNNQHSSEFGPISLSDALRPVPMDVDKEKIGESGEHLKVNIIKEVVHYRRRDGVL